MYVMGVYLYLQFFMVCTVPRDNLLLFFARAYVYRSTCVGTFVSTYTIRHFIRRQVAGFANDLRICVFVYCRNCMFVCKQLYIHVLRCHVSLVLEIFTFYVWLFYCHYNAKVWGQLWGLDFVATAYNPWGPSQHISMVTALFGQLYWSSGILELTNSSSLSNNHNNIWAYTTLFIDINS